MAQPHDKDGLSDMTSPSKLSIDAVSALIRETDQGAPLADERVAELTGISGLKTVGLLQRLVRMFEGDDSACYLEVGVFQGLTLISSSIAAPTLPCFGIYNFATLDPDGMNIDIVQRRLQKYDVKNAQLINEDFEVALQTLGARLDGRKVAVYFVDGPHDYRSQLICLMLIKPFLHERAVIIVDDANYPDVRWSTRDFLLGHNNFKMLFETYSPAHPANMSDDIKTGHELGWLNGINVMVRDPEGHLDEMLPPTAPRERDIYLNEWLAHRLRLADLAPEALVLADKVCRADQQGEGAARKVLQEKYQDNATYFDSLFEDRNVFSDDLPSSRLNG